jgi:hypothetical protein
MIRPGVHLTPGLYYCDEDFKRDAILFFEECRAALEAEAVDDPVKALQLTHLPDFKASNTFIAAFWKRQRLSLRRPSLKKRPKVKEEQIETFIAQGQELLERYPRNPIINIDETNWRTVAAGFLTWAETGAESVTCHIEDDEKAGVTAIAAITAEGEKLPLTVLGKGKTPRCLAGFVLKIRVEQCRRDVSVFCLFENPALQWPATVDRNPRHVSSAPRPVGEIHC